MKVIRALTLTLCCLGVATLLKQRVSPCKVHYRDYLHYTTRSCMSTIQQQLIISHPLTINGMDSVCHTRKDCNPPSKIMLFAKTSAAAGLPVKRSRPITKILNFLLAVIMFIPNILFRGLSLVFGRRSSITKERVAHGNSTILQSEYNQNSQSYQWYNEAYMRAKGRTKSIFGNRPWASQKKWSPYNVINKEGDLSPQSILKWRIKSNETTLTSFSYPSSFSGPAKEAQKLIVVELNRLNNTRGFSLDVKEFVKVPKVSTQHGNSNNKPKTSPDVTSTIAFISENLTTISKSLSSTRSDQLNSKESMIASMNSTMNIKAAFSSETQSIPKPKELLIPSKSTSILVQSFALYPNSEYSTSTPPIPQQQKNVEAAVASDSQTFVSANNTTTQVTNEWTDDDASLIGSLMTGVMVTAAFGWEPGLLMTATSAFLIARNYNITGKIVHSVGELALASIKVARVIDDSFNISSTIKSQVASALKLPKK